MTLPAQSLNSYLRKLSNSTKASWKAGSHDFQRAKIELRTCKNKDCVNKFEVKTYDPKKFCSKKCAAHVNNQGRSLSKETKLKIANTLSPTPVTVLKSENIRIKRNIPPFVIEKGELEKLYLVDKLTSGEIANKFGITNFRVLKRMNKYKIPRRTAAESNNIRYAKQPPSYDFKPDLTDQEKLLYNSAVMLYWAEGGKRSGKDGLRKGVDFVNSDEKMVLVFLSALRRIFRVNESKLRVYLYCYANQDVESLKQYWSDLLKIPLDQFSKPYVRQNFKEDKIGKMPHGLVHLRYNDKKLFMQIMAQIDIIASTFNSPRW